MRRVLRALLAIAVVGALVWVNPLRADAAAPSLKAPERVYGQVNLPLPFTPGAQDAISGDDLDVEVELVDVGNDCDTSEANNYDITTCPRVQMIVNSGILAIDIEKDLTDPADPDGVAKGGAIYESTNGDGTGPVINLNGTDAQINEALDTLVYAPETDVENDDSTPFILAIDAIDDDPATATVEADVQIRVDTPNQGPTLTVPPTQNVAASSVTPLPAVAPAVATPPNPGDWNVEDVDIKDGDPDSMLLVMWVTCGTFSLRGSSLPTDGAVADNIVDYVEGRYGTDAAYQADRDALVATILGGLPADVLSAPIETSAADVAKTGYAGIGTIDEIVYLISQVTYNAPADKGTCDLWTVVSDLGNDGLPVAYLGSPLGGKDTPQPGFETPDQGIDQDFTTFVVDGGAKLSVPAELTVAEGSAIDIPVAIDTDKHPDIPVGFTATDVSTTAADYTVPAPFVYPENDGGPVNASFSAAADADVEGDEFVYVALDVSGDGVTADPDTVLIKITDTTETTTTTEATTTTIDPGSTTTIIVVTTTIDPGSTTTTDPGTTTTTDPGTTTTTDPGTTTTTDPGTTTTTDAGTTTTTDPGTTTTTDPGTTTTTDPGTTTTTDPGTTTTTDPGTTTTTDPGTTTTTDPGTTTTTDPGTTTTTDPGTTTTTDGGTTTTTDGGTTTTTDGGTTTTTDGGTTTTTTDGVDGTTTTTTGAGGPTTTDGGVSGGGTDNGGGGSVDDGTLARTGSDSRSLVLLGVMGVTMGGIVLIARRRLFLRQG